MKRKIDGKTGMRLVEARHACGYSQAWVAKRIGVTVGTIQAYEHGRARISSDRLKELAQVFRCDPATLLKCALFLALLQ